MNRQLLFLLFSLTFSFFNSSFSMVYRPYYTIGHFLSEIKDPQKKQTALYYKAVELIQDNLEKDVYLYGEENVRIFLSNMEFGARGANLNVRLFFEQLKEFVMQEIVRYAPPHNKSAYNAAKWAVGLGVVSIICLGGAYLFYRKNIKPHSDKLNEIENNLKKMGAEIKEEVVVEKKYDFFPNTNLYIPRIEDLFKENREINYYKIRYAKFKPGLSLEQRNCVDNYVTEYHTVDGQIKECFRLDCLGVITSFFPIMCAVGYGGCSFIEWIYAYDKKRYQLLSFMRDEIDTILLSL